MQKGVKPHRLISWMGLIKITRRSLHVNENVDMSNNCIVHCIGKNGPLVKLNSKTIYEELISQKLGSEPCVPRAAKYLENSGSLFYTIYKFILARGFYLDKE